MDEEPKTEQSTDNSGEGDKSEIAKETELANAAAERMEKASEKLDAATAKARLGGISEAGQTAPVEKEETDKEYNDRIDKEISEGKHAE